jgi:predicted porin
MNKKLLALAVAGAFVAPVAMADTSNVVIGGQMHFSLDSLDGKNAAGTDLTNKVNVSSNASNIYFKGTEDLGNGLSAFWQVQTYFSAGGTGNTDTTNGSVDGVSSGNTFVGLEGKSWGKVLLGKHESPFKLISRKVDLFNNQIGDTRNLVSNASGAANAIYSAGWDLRPQNVIAYGTPNFNGFSALVAYVSNVGTGAAIDSPSNTAQTCGLNTTGGTVCTSGNVTNNNAVNAWSANATYENGPIFVGLGYEKHNLSKLSTAAAANHSDEKAWRLAGGYNFGDFKVVGLYQRESGLCVGTITGCAANGTDAKRTTWGLGGAYKMGANTLKLQYYRAGDLSNSGLTNESDTGANLWSLGVDHALSKRTTVYAAYARTNNDRYAMYSAFGGGHGDNPGTVTPTATQDSKDPSGFSLGVIHNF